MTTLSEKLSESWHRRWGIAGWISTTDHKRIGLRYLYTGFVFLILAGIEALIIRTQLAGANLNVVTAEAYNQLFSMHGLTMMFLAATPVLSGFGNYFMPLMVGARDMAFPRLNAFGYWVFLGAGLFLNSAFLIGQAPNAGGSTTCRYRMPPSRRVSTSSSTRLESSSSESQTPQERSTSS